MRISIIFNHKQIQIVNNTVQYSPTDFYALKYLMISKTTLQLIKRHEGAYICIIAHDSVDKVQINSMK